MKSYFSYTGILPFIILILGVLSSCNELITIDTYNEDTRIRELYCIDKDSLIQGVKITEIDGVLYEKAEYRDGALNGLRTIFFPDGNIEIEENYVSGVLTDTLKVFHSNGKLKISMPYKNGSLEGVVMKYNTDGNLIEKVSFKDNEENGLFEEYFPDGGVHWRGQYLNGPNEFDILEEYNESGVLLKRMLCDSIAICRTIWTKENGDIVPQ